MSRTLVTFHAHPDDESLFTAGTMAKAAAAGHRVVLVVATAGEVGEADAAHRGGDPAALAAVRLGELRRAAEVLGVARVEVLGYADSGSDPDAVPATAAAGQVPFSRVDVDVAAERLAEILRGEEADVLTTYDRHGGYGHPDHRQVHHVGHRAAELAGTPIVLEATINRELLKAGVELAGSLGYEIPADFRPERFDEWFLPEAELTHAVDVQAFLPQKRAAMAAHESQTTSSSGGPRSLEAFLSLPEEYYALAFGTEWFVQKGRPAGIAADDVFAGLTDPTDAAGA